ncbi:DMT family transporter [Pseudovibrio flavus]|uniref:DMT family transporter n=1 Tax=Pseudovibrio flavus TaxID=2529854 RepID=UPI00211BA5C3|nr:DMT family transporter [Pseudovibrio flavus]
MSSSTINKAAPIWATNLQAKGALMALAGALLMSIEPVIVRFSGTSAINTAFLFGLYTAISMPIFIQLLDKRGLFLTLKESGWPVLAAGLLMLGSASGLILSIKLTSIANTFIIMSSTPAISALFSWMLTGEKTKASTWVAISLVMMGIGIVVFGSFGQGNWVGDALALFAVVCLSLIQALMRKYQNTSRMASVGMGGFFMAATLFFFAEPASFSLNTWLIMAIMGLFTAPFGRVLAQTATRYITPAEVGLILMVETILAPLFGFAVFGEVPPVLTLVGGSVILTTVFTYVFAAFKQA